MYTPDQINKIDPNIVADLRKVYLAIYGSAITADLPDLAVSTGLKRSYVNELVQLLTQIPATDSDTAREGGESLVILNMAAGEKLNGEPIPLDLWQTFYTVDDESEEKAKERINRALVQVKAKPSATPAKPSGPVRSGPVSESNPAGLPLCLCGCGEALNNRKRNYKPGHDARHAGQVARAVASGVASDEMIDNLPTDALQTKARDMVVRLRAKAAGRPATPVPGHITVNKVKYEALRHPDGHVTYTNKRGVENSVATEKQAATFEIF